MYSAGKDTSHRLQCSLVRPLHRVPSPRRPAVPLLLQVHSRPSNCLFVAPQGRQPIESLCCLSNSESENSTQVRNIAALPYNHIPLPWETHLARIAAAANAIDKAKFLVDAIERKLQCALTRHSR